MCTILLKLNCIANNIQTQTNALANYSPLPTCHKTTTFKQHSLPLEHYTIAGTQVLLAYYIRFIKNNSSSTTLITYVFTALTARKYISLLLERRTQYS